jgi:hypothetical protein
MNRQRYSGQALTEFLVVATSLALALFYPYVNGESVVTLLLRTLMRAMRARAFLVSVMT